METFNHVITHEKYLYIFSVYSLIRFEECLLPFDSVLSSCLLCRNVKVTVYRTIILPFILYGCETWFLTLREEHRLGMLDNRVVRRIFGPKRNEATGEWRKLHNVELHNLYLSPYTIRQISQGE
jgi:hypothetical protein